MPGCVIAAQQIASRGHHILKSANEKLPSRSLSSSSPDRKGAVPITLSSCFSIKPSPRGAFIRSYRAVAPFSAQSQNLFTPSCPTPHSHQWLSTRRPIVWNTRIAPRHKPNIPNNNSACLSVFQIFAQSQDPTSPSPCSFGRQGFGASHRSLLFGSEKTGRIWHLKKYRNICIYLNKSKQKVSCSLL